MWSQVSGERRKRAQSNADIQFLGNLKFVPRLLRLLGRGAVQHNMEQFSFLSSPSYFLSSFSHCLLTFFSLSLSSPQLYSLPPVRRTFHFSLIYPATPHVHSAHSWWMDFGLFALFFCWSQTNKNSFILRMNTLRPLRGTNNIAWKVWCMTAPKHNIPLLPSQAISFLCHVWK